jgi:hypothetical protein
MANNQKSDNTIEPLTQYLGPGILPTESDMIISNPEVKRTCRKEITSTSTRLELFGENRGTRGHAS